MDPKIDLAKLVGAASAPVALIISTSIFLSNLTTKHLAMCTTIRELLKEIREKPDDENREHSLQGQSELYRRRLRWLMRATFWLTVSIICFIVTVLLTAAGVVFPDTTWLTITTAFAMFGGLALLAAAVVMEAWENHMGKKTLELETNEGTTEFTSGQMVHR
jgi:Na+/melibiose symporter-like transporter